MRLAGAGTGAEAGSWGRLKAVHLGSAAGAAAVGDSACRFAVRSGRGREAQTTPAYVASGGGYGDGDGAAPSRSARAPLRAYAPATRLHNVMQEELSRGGPDGVRKAWRRDGDGDWDQHQNRRNGSSWRRRR
ncbi:hypothetical protein DFH08DRAFT_960182 [Mycena albidolilacea]|uniref:Uncharacterized protein n=1 Tax=Mycena albidolilacea TaxID=1033008 RepID=A0AAD7A2I7_9AGAR|nr:hypothetical protein DFH08DRAFT_960182 [Mycena albidolilacea]